MALVPKQTSLPSTGLTANEESILDPNNVSVSIRNGKRTVEGYDDQGRKVTMTTHIGQSERSTGFRRQSMTVCDQLSIEERKKVARQLRDEGMTQDQIASQLGVSQKTVSNDLKP
ncbi:helix-turn-helix domain-containing protein [Bacterioplanoides sp.]|uniref:helix-turn-helix domain-containing protein n=1 Tax=Bacterioplanoides sp. TaxID=2066072 RepID=UPI003B5C3377